MPVLSAAHPLKSIPCPITCKPFIAAAFLIIALPLLLQSMHFSCVSRPRITISNQVNALPYRVKALLGFATSPRCRAYPALVTAIQIPLNSGLFRFLPVLGSSLPLLLKSRLFPFSSDLSQLCRIPSIRLLSASYRFCSFPHRIDSAPFRIMSILLRCHASPVSSCPFQSIAILVRAIPCRLSSPRFASSPSLVLLRYRCHWV